MQAAANDYQKPRIRAAIAKVYHGKCQYCGVEGANHVDHIQPRSKGGSDALENLILACQGCNLRKRNIVLEPMHIAIAVSLARENAEKIRRISQAGFVDYPRQYEYTKDGWRVRGLKYRHRNLFTLRDVVQGISLKMFYEPQTYLKYVPEDYTTTLSVRTLSESEGVNLYRIFGCNNQRFLSLEGARCLVGHSKETSAFAFKTWLEAEVSVAMDEQYKAAA